MITAANRAFKFAKRRMHWHGQNPVAELETGERPRVSAAARRPIFRGNELADTLAAAIEPYKTLFAHGSVTGARLSECLGLVWVDLSITDLAAAEVRFEYQVDRQGRRQPLKTKESRRTVDIPRQLAAMLVRHKRGSANTSPSAFVFATRTGRPIQQRKSASPSGEHRQTLRTRRAARRSLYYTSGITRVGYGPSPRECCPRSRFRHAVASEAIAAGESAEEVSWQLGQKNSLITRAVYIQEIKSAERTARRRTRMEARYGDLLDAAASGTGSHRRSVGRPWPRFQPVPEQSRRLGGGLILGQCQNGHRAAIASPSSADVGDS